jgi:hypothetical protein
MIFDAAHGADARVRAARVEHLFSMRLRRIYGLGSAPGAGSFDNAAIRAQAR